MVRPHQSGRAISPISLEREPTAWRSQAVAWLRQAEGDARADRLALESRARRGQIGTKVIENARRNMEL